MILKTERLLIRKFDSNDIDLIYEINNDKECIEFNGWDSMSISECEKVLNKWISNYNQNNQYGVFCVEDIKTNESIGMAFIMKSVDLDNYEIGFRLRRFKWGLGYAKEISLGFIDYGNEILNASKIFAEVHSVNKRSRNIFEKIGFDILEHPDGPSGILYEYKLNE